MRDELRRLVPYCFALILFILFSHALPARAQDNEAKPKEVPNFARVNDRLYRGGQPRKEGIQKLATLGVTTIINLRDDDDRALTEESEAKAAGIRYFNVPFKELGRPKDSDVDKVLSLIDAKENGVVFVHCHRGEDRTGTVIALYRISHDHWTDEQAIHEAKQFGMKFWQVSMRHYISDYYDKKSGHLSKSENLSPK
jgi:tyrosine-protein phosphatase SIW14